MLGDGLFLSTRFPHFYLPGRDVHRLPSWKNGAFSLARVYVLKQWQRREFLTSLCIGDIISEVAEIQFCCAVACLEAVASKVK